jgi:hypothetical protein
MPHAAASAVPGAHAPIKASAPAQPAARRPPLRLVAPSACTCPEWCALDHAND